MLARGHQVALAAGRQAAVLLLPLPMLRAGERMGGRVGGAAGRQAGGQGVIGLPGRRQARAESTGWGHWGDAGREVAGSQDRNVPSPAFPQAFWQSVE